MNFDPEAQHEKALEKYTEAKAVGKPAVELARRETGFGIVILAYFAAFELPFSIILYRSPEPCRHIDQTRTLGDGLRLLNAVAGALESPIEVRPTANPNYCHTFVLTGEIECFTVIDAGVGYLDDGSGRLDPCLIDRRIALNGGHYRGAVRVW